MASDSLYALTSDLLALRDELVDAGGAVDDETEARHDALLGSLEDKGRAYIAVIRDLETRAAATSEERKRLQARENALASSAKRMKERLLESMLARGLDVEETALGKIRVQRAGTSLHVLADAEALPERYQRVSVSADKAALREALEDGDPEAVGLAEIVPGAPYVRIY